MSDSAAPANAYRAIHDEMGVVLIGNDDIVEGLTTALLTRGHVLLEGVPGVAKTTIANLFARASGLSYNRIQMTPDVLPADITGTHVYREATGEFELQKGPLFANVVVADEINRATPKTQSALLEAMQETNVTIEGETRQLPEPFLVIATQNPIEMEGSLPPDETLFMDGALWMAGDALEYARNVGELIHETDDIRVYDADITTETLDERGQLQTVDALLYEKQYAGELYTLRTKTGRKITVSGNHPFLVNRSGALQWVCASELETADHLVSPDTLDGESRPFDSHRETLLNLADEYDHRVVLEEDLQQILTKIDDGSQLTRDETDALRIARGWSKADLADRVTGTYDQVLNYFDGCETPVGEEIDRVLQSKAIDPGDYVEAYRSHRFEREPTNEEAGFITGFVLSDGHLGSAQLSIIQKNLPAKFDRWVDIVEDLGFEVRVTDVKGGRRATVDSKPLCDYFRDRYAIDEPATLLCAPNDFRKAFLEIFLLAESHYDRERRRITFVQKDRRTTNIIAHLLLQFGIRPWIHEKEDRYEIRIQGEDIGDYLTQFKWRGTPPCTEEFAGNHRTVPLPADEVDRLVDVLGVRAEGAMSERDWYNAYTYLQSGENVSTEHLARSFVEEMTDLLAERQAIDPHAAATADLGQTAKLCGISITDIVDGTSLTKHRVWQAYQGEDAPEEAIDFVTEVYTERIREAEQLTAYLESLLDGDVFYDPIETIEQTPYEGPVIGLSVPQTHNYLAGLGACGINHNTFSLPEAQQDRFQFKFTVDLPSRTEEKELLDRFDREPTLGPENVSQVISPQELLAAREAVDDVYVADAVKEYVLDLVAATRESPETEYGASPRASLAFLHAGKARAAIHGRQYVIPDDIKAIAHPVLQHRLVLGTDAELSDVSPTDVIDDILGSVEPPSSNDIKWKPIDAADSSSADDVPGDVED